MEFFTDTPFDRWLIFRVSSGFVDSISFSEKKSGVGLAGELKATVENVFEKRDLGLFDYDVLNLEGLTEKARKLHNFLISTKMGETFSYSDVACRIFGSEKYRRVVAMLLRKNRFAFFVPCHRIVAKNGIGGYSATVELKIKILAWEGVFYI